MSVQDAIVLVATIAFALTTLGIAATIDYHDWGLLGLMVLCGGVAMLGAATLLHEMHLDHGWRGDLRWTWLLLVCVGAALVVTGQVNRVKNHWAWPPKWRIFVRIVVAALTPVAIVVVIHLLRGLS